MKATEESTDARRARSRSWSRACTASCSRPATPATTRRARSGTARTTARPALIVRCAGAADVIARGRLRPQRGARRRGARRRPQHPRLLDGRRRHRHRPLADEGRRASTPTRRARRAGGGVTWAELDPRPRRIGLATTGGLVSTTGVAGFTLGGGIGWLMRKHGLACDNLRRAPRSSPPTAGSCTPATTRTPTCSGACAAAAATSASSPRSSSSCTRSARWSRRPGLLRRRGRRDGSSRFATCTAGRCPTSSRARQPADRAAGAVPAGGVARQARSRLIGCYAGDHAEGERLLAPLRATATPVADLVGPMPYVAMQRLIDPLWPARRAAT